MAENGRLEANSRVKRGFTSYIRLQKTTFRDFLGTPPDTESTEVIQKVHRVQTGPRGHSLAPPI